MLLNRFFSNLSKKRRSELRSFLNNVKRAVNHRNVFHLGKIRVIRYRAPFIEHRDVDDDDRGFPFSSDIRESCNSAPVGKNAWTFPFGTIIRFAVHARVLFSCPSGGSIALNRLMPLPYDKVAGEENYFSNVLLNYLNILSRWKYSS